MRAGNVEVKENGVREESAPGRKLGMWKGGKEVRDKQEESHEEVLRKESVTGSFRK